MEEEGEISSPFWLQRSANRRRTSSLFFNSGVLLFTLCLAFSLFIFFILPPIISLTPQIFKPKNLVKKSWDSVNVTLVLLALIFGFLSRNRNPDSSLESFDDRINNKNRNEVNQKEKSNESTPRGWYEYTDRTAVIGLRRTYSSYPDLREISPLEDSNDRWRFYDDTSLDSYWRNENIGPRMGSNIGKIAPIPVSEAREGRIMNEFTKRVDGGRGEIYASESKIVESQRFVPAASGDGKANQAYEGLKVESQRFVPTESNNRKANQAYEGLKIESQRSVPAESDNRKANQAYEGLKIESHRFMPAESDDRKPSPAYESILVGERVIRQVEPPVVRRRTRRQSTGSIENKGESIKQVSDSEPPEQFTHRKMKRKDEQEEEIAIELDTNEYYKLLPPSKSERKRGSGSGNATRNFLDSFRKKKKKQRQRSVENFEMLIGSQPPLPPPLPPQNFFSFKKEKNKKFITVPPPPPPPPPHIVRAQKSIVTRRPPLPVKIRNFTDEAPTSGGDSPLTGAESPLHPIPPPPPPPPFKMPSWKFVVKGDYVKIGSISSSRSVSPDPDELDSPTSTESGETPTAVEGAEVAAGAMFCPSPDVNSKADMFIAKFRAGLKLQKMNSLKQKQGVGLSNLGPSTKPRSDSSIS